MLVLGNLETFRLAFFSLIFPPVGRFARGIVSPGESKYLVVLCERCRFSSRLIPSFRFDSLTGSVDFSCGDVHLSGSGIFQKRKPSEWQQLDLNSFTCWTVATHLQLENGQWDLRGVWNSIYQRAVPGKCLAHSDTFWLQVAAFNWYVLTGHFVHWVITQSTARTESSQDNGCKRLFIQNL